ncbi:MAG TPA: adenylate/guanylate cyclase domain-containing protein [Thermomicrobiaceae bacterium]|nr:adenylate/guanylate cyclase domain-containing protein [Thermomicrobiaceae bacterium]
MPAALTVTANARTDPGAVRVVNGDSLATREPTGPLDRAERGAIWAIADGVGLRARGLQASRLAARTVVDSYWTSAIPDPATRLRAAVEHTNAILYAQNPADADAAGPTNAAGATILAGIVVDDRLIAANAGRSRVYLLRDGALRQLTQDHTWVAEQLRLGALTPEEAANHPRRNVITRCLGIRETVDVDVVEQPLAPGDLVLFCSDGLYRDVDEARIAELLRAHGAAAAPSLIEEARARGGQDNVTAVTIAVDGEPTRPEAVVDRIALLNRLGRELTASLDLDATLQSALRQVLAISGGDHAAILLRDERGELVTRASQGSRDFGLLVQHSTSVVEQALRECRPVLVPNALEDPSFGAALSIVGRSLRAIACVPMIVNQEPIGAVYVDSSRRAVEFEQLDLDLLVSIGAQIGGAIQNATLHRDLLARTADLEAARRRQDALLRSLSSALVAVDDRGVITDWNPTAAEVLGVPASTAVGTLLAHLAPSGLAAWLGGLVAMVQVGAPTVISGPEWEGAIGGRPRVVLAGRAARIRDAHGEVGGVVLILDDRTDIVLMEEARRRETAERDRLRELFSRYVAPPVVEQLLRSPDALALGGSRCDVTVLFADVRGFTGFSESHRPEEVVALLNSYLELATSEIFKQLGMLDKFLGDGVMAIFGAPLTLPDHELAAVRAALSMRERIAELRRETGTRAGFGIGLNSGSAIVGNIGTPQVMSYTAIGDVVNVTARLQAEARAGEILISESTLERIRGTVEVEELGPLYVKGRAAPIATYKLLRLSGEPAAIGSRT